ncbi:MAG TPA: putative ABC exporter domain-containing protein [Pseudolabrys sp.]
MSRPDTLTWLAVHELRLSWRDGISLMTAGRRNRMSTIAIALIIFAVVMHLLAWTMVNRYAGEGLLPDKATLVIVSGLLLLSWSLLLSQAMESVTRAFYARSDLDLILTSPVSPRKVFSVRIARIALSVALIAVFLAAPFINVLALLGGPRWLAAYGVVAAMGTLAAAIAVALTIALFRTIGAKRTRLAAQIVAAVIGAAFVIGLQVAAILTYGNLSRFSVLQSHWLIAHAPNVGNVIWFPARAVLGDSTALAAVIAASLALLGLSIAIFAGNFGNHVVAAAGVSSAVVRQRRWSLHFRRRSPSRVLRQKEWTLLARDPWLMSQTLMQILYLLPPALLLWKGFQGGTSAIIVLVPVVVMAAGQLGGGLAWLSISGEDAPDLVASAPIPARRILWAKIEAVMGAIAVVFAPFILALAFASTRAALVTAIGTLVAAASATMVQLCFRTQARRSQFRRRQTSSRIATFAEAFSSIAWAGAAALVAAGSWLALFPAVIAIGILAGVKLIAPPSTN